MKRSQRNALNDARTDNKAREEGPTKKIHLLDLKPIQPKTKTQSKLFAAWQQDRQKSLFLHGSAGSGKTFLALYTSLHDVLSPNSQYEKVMIVRSVVPARDMGFLPGTKEEKAAVYEAPYMGICQQLFGPKTSYDVLKKAGKIDFEPTSFLRGTTFDNTIIVVDESQNLSFEELNTVMTRVGENSKIIFCGDSRQNDLHYKKGDDSGFAQFLTVIQKLKKHFTILEFDAGDIVRSGLVKDYILALENPKDEPKNEGVKRTLKITRERTRDV